MNAALLAFLQVGGRPPLPAGPPIGGFVWTVVVPAALLLVSATATWALWRHFADRDD